MPVFRLSNAQRKELYVRRRPLLIALPLSDADYRESRHDPRAVAARLLPDIDETIYSAEIGSVEIGVPLAHARGVPRDLTGAVGALTHGRPCTGDVIGLRVEVLLVWLCHGDPRHAQALAQWPLCAVIDGAALPAPPKPKEEENDATQEK